MFLGEHRDGAACRHSSGPVLTTPQTRLSRTDGRPWKTAVFSKLTGVHQRGSNGDTSRPPGTASPPAAPRLSDRAARTR